MSRHIVTKAVTAVRHFRAAAAAAVPNPGKFTPSSSPPSTSSSSRSNGGRETLGKKLLSLVHPKRSAVVTIRKWKEEGNSIRKYELNRIVRELRRLKRYKHALEICEWMRTQEDIKLLSGDYAVHLDLIAKLRGLSSAEQFFSDMPERMRSEPTLSSLLHTYVQHRAYDEAEALMAKMTECGYLSTPLPYNHMMTMYLENGKVEKIPELIRELKRNTTPDIVSYNLWLTMCQSRNDVETAENVFLELKRAKIEPDWITYSILTCLYTRRQLNDKAESALKEMEKRVSRKRRSAYASLISLHANLGNKKGADRIWNTMKLMFPRLNDAEYTCMVASLIKLDELKKAEKLYDKWESISPTGDARIPNLLIGEYVNKNQIEKARTFFDRIEKKGIKPSYTTWELLTRGNLKSKQTDRALYCFEKALCSVKKWEPNLGFVHEIYELLEEQQDIKGAEKLLSLLRKAGYVTTEIYKWHLRTYAKAEKMPPIIEERMAKDKVVPDLETEELLKVTSKMCVTDVSSCL
ncbi:hypothetical protein RND81_08G225200 [Saponaria officinalis]|uniref:Pentatricopeptide repeat-containing protein n=1 Tax=Saponaria officinalis TaxID=3572 RepID=A0AAW1JBL3_SAPOF